MWPFKQNQLKSIQEQINAIELKNQLIQAQSTLARLSDESIYKPPMLSHNVKESLATNLLASTSLEKVFMGAVALWEIPAMIRNQWPYKQILIQTIVQLDFIRWVGRVLYNDCPTFGTAIEAMAAQVLGSHGLTFKVFSLDKKRENIKESEISPGEADDPDSAQVKEVQEYISEIDEVNDLLRWEKEVFIRYHREGEVFVHVQKPDRSEDEDGVPEIRVIEPDYIRPSILKGQSQEDPNVSMQFNGGEDWSFGIHNKPFRWYHPEKYNVLWPPDFSREEVLDAKDMFHWAFKEARNQKRGIPTSFKITEDLINVTLHREADAQSAIKRAKITGIIQYNTNIDPSYVHTDLATLGKNDRAETPESELYSIATLGLNTKESDWVGVLKGREFKEFPMTDATSSDLIYKRSLSTIAAYYGLPLSTFGLQGEHAFAAALIEETIPTRRREFEQGDLCRYWRSIIKRCVEHKFGEEIWDKVDLKVTGPSVVIRDEKTQAETHIARIGAKLESRESAQLEMGLDPDQEDAIIESDPIAAKMDLQEQELAGPKGSKGEGEKTIAGERQKLEGDKERATPRKD